MKVSINVKAIYALLTSLFEQEIDIERYSVPKANNKHFYKIKSEDGKLHEYIDFSQPAEETAEKATRIVDYVSKEYWGQEFCEDAGNPYSSYVDFLAKFLNEKYNEIIDENGTVDEPLLITYLPKLSLNENLLSELLSNANITDEEFGCILTCQNMYTTLLEKMVDNLENEQPGDMVNGEIVDEAYQNAFAQSSTEIQLALSDKNIAYLSSPESSSVDDEFDRARAKVITLAILSPNLFSRFSTTSMLNNMTAFATDTNELLLDIFPSYYNLHNRETKGEDTLEFQEKTYKDILSSFDVCPDYMSGDILEKRAIRTILSSHSKNLPNCLDRFINSCITNNCSDYICYGPQKHIMDSVLLNLASIHQGLDSPTENIDLSEVNEQELLDLFDKNYDYACKNIMTDAKVYALFNKYRDGM